RGSDRDGGLSEHPDPPVVAAAHHASHRDCAGGTHGYLLRGERYRQAPHREPGDPQPAAVVRGVPARVVHFPSSEDGGSRERHLEDVSARLEADGLDVDAVLAAGDPAKEIAAAAERERCDLIAMATHGHRLLEDVVKGSTATALRHQTTIPILMVRAEKK